MVNRPSFTKLSLEFLYTHTHYHPCCLCDPADLQILISIRVLQGKKKLGLSVH